MSEPIPVTILAGFLGAGKTTLLNRILRQAHGQRLAVLVNDFGQIDIDAQLLASAVDGKIVSLPNGCICCSLFGNLVETFRRLIQIAPPLDRILIEASGVSAPDQIAAILQVQDIAAHVALDGIITLADAENVRRIAQAMTFIEGQLAAADLILLNKIDLITPDQQADLNAWLRQVAPAARIIPTRFADVPLEWVLGQGFGSSRAETPLSDHAQHDLAYESWSYQAERPFARAALLATMANLPPRVYRAKGIVWLADAADAPMVLQVVGQRLRLQPAEAGAAAERSSQVVVIGEPGAMTEAELAAALDHCLA